MMQRILKSAILFFVVLNTIIHPFKVQAGEGEALRYVLDAETLSRGFPVASKNKRFTLLVWPLVFYDAISVELKPYQSLPRNGEAYKFRIERDGTVPLLKKPLAITFATKGTDEFRYKRLYYLHEEGGEWLALRSLVQKEKGVLLSPSVDFGEGIVGMFFDTVALPDRILAVNPDAEKNSLIMASTFDPSDRFTIALGDDIIEKGYTIEWKEASLIIPPKVLQEASDVTLGWSADQTALDFNFVPKRPHLSPITAGKNLLLQLPASSTTMYEKIIAFWDKNLDAWRELPSAYYPEMHVVRAVTPFHFGTYRVQDKKDAVRGMASWFPDAMVSKTRYAGASNDYPLHEHVLVTNLANKKQVKVEIVSVGPFVEGRVIDLTKTAFRAIASPLQGVIQVKIEKAQ
jgi:hypothetical protein